ncbi:MAG TPA: glycosyltransferase family 2 protein [Anaerolineales bacterium]|nr:glycosyltransferase family 2 protein [Anaerolineales bacterium]
MEKPFVSVIIVNYNGKRYLSACLDGLRAQAYPEQAYEVVVSDNGSSDGSLELLQSVYPWVRVLANGRNLGFASGNNVAIHATQGKYAVLLNNDTVPAPDWLEHLVQVAETNPSAGLVTGRLQLYYPQVILRLETEAFSPPEDDRQLGVQIYQVQTGLEKGVVQYLQGFFGREGSRSGQIFRWTQGQALLGIPVPDRDGAWRINLRLAAAGRPGSSVPLRISAGGIPLADWHVSGEYPHDFSLELPAEVRLLARPLVQNTGSIIFSNGASRDRGTYVAGTEVLFELDEDQYNQVEEVFAGCGANLLLRRQMLEQVGLFDDDFFMYYEDTDLSWRARLFGWQVLYAPEALVRHIHCGTSEEWSPFFTYHVERNHLAMVFKNGSWRQIRRTWLNYPGSLVKNLLRLSVSLLRRGQWRSYAGQVKKQARVLGSLLVWLPMLLRKRSWIQRRRQANAGQMEAWFTGS